MRKESIVKNEDIEDHSKMIESLIERAAEYGKTSLELVKLRALDKASDVVSSLITKYLVINILLIFLLFFNLGLSLWLGEILGEPYYGFFVIAAFYGTAGMFIYFVMLKWFKRLVSNNFIKQVLK